MDSGTYRWNVDQLTLQRMKQSKNKREFLSPTFEVSGLSWRFEISPNGYRDDRPGSFDLFVKCLHMPSAWDHIECFLLIRCSETKSGGTIYTKYKAQTAFGWGKNNMLLSEIQELDSLTFDVDIFVHRIVLKEEKQIFYERDIPACHQSMVWNIDKKTLQILKGTHSGKRIHSKMFGVMYNCFLTKGESHCDFDLRLCVLPKGKRKINLSWTTEVVANGNHFEKVFTVSRSKELAMEKSGTNPQLLSIEDIMKCDSLMFNVNVTVNDDQKAIALWNQVAQHQNNDDEKNETNMLNVRETDDIGQSEERLLLMKARIDSLESAMESMASKLTVLDSFEAKLNQNNKQSMALQEQAAKATQSKFDQMQNHITSIDSKLKEVQKPTDGKFRRQSESNQSQSVEILAMMNKLKEEMAALKEAQNQGDEELKEETEEMKMKKWMEDEVKLPQYFDLLKENGFEDLDGVQDLTDNDLREMGIEKMGHRRKIIKFVSKLKATNTESVQMQSPAQQYHVPVAAAAYSFGVAQPAKVDAEGPNLVDTGH